MFLASPPAVAPRRQPRGLPGDAIPNEVRDASLTLGRTGWAVAPNAPLYVAPSVSEGSLGANAPREDRGDVSPKFPFCHSERSEGCLAIARQDRVRSVAPSVPFHVAPNDPFLCHPERKRGVPRRLRASGRQGGLSPRA